MEFCFTFGCGSPLAKCYVEVEAPDENHARLMIFAMFSRHWASCYPKVGFEQQIEQYGLTRIPVNFDQLSVRLGTNHEEIPLDIYTQLYGGPR